MKNHKSHKLSDLNINGAISEVYLMDCVEAMKQYPDKHFSLACVDPPYGLGDSVVNSGGRFKRYENKRGNWDNATPTEEYFNELFRVSQNQVIWGGNYFGLPPTKCFLIWDKQQPQGVSFAMCEYAWTSFDSVAKVFYKRTQGQKFRFHPTQKLVELYDWIFKNYAKEGDLILDTHLGSQSSRIAANKANLDFIGFEIDEDYFNEGNERFKTFVSQMRLF